MPRQPRIAIIGAGMGGLAAAATLQHVGIEVAVFEQASRFSRLGAGIQMGPNAVRVLRALGLEDELRARSFQPRSWMNREWDSGEVRFDFELGAFAEDRYGAPYLQLHRGDLHDLLLSAVDADDVRLSSRLVGIDETHDGVRLSFEDGSTAQADAVVGADGVHSRVREILHGPGDPFFTGRVAYRAVYRAERLGGFEIDDNTKWWGPDRHIVIYFLNPRKDELYFVTSVPEPDWTIESWSSTGDLGELRAEYEGFHEQVQRVLGACPSVHKWALVQREPLKQWREGRVTLLGDSCHPMVPYMAQGAAMAIEDAAVLARCLAGAEVDGLDDALQRYEDTRQERTARVQRSSFENRWMSGPTDGDWVYAYDALTVPLGEGPAS